MTRSKVSRSLYFFILVFTSLLSYIVLSIDKSEVFFYLYDENKYSLFNSVIKIYGLSLVFIFILSYRASFYIFRQKKDELGLLLAEGISRRKLFKILMKNTRKDLFRANFYGLILGVFISEFINLLTIKLLRLGIGNHYFIISLKALSLTFLISILISSLSNYLLAARLYRLSPEDIFRGDFKKRPKKLLILALVFISIFIIYNLQYRYSFSLIFLGLFGLFMVFFYYLVLYLLLKRSKKGPSLSLLIKKYKGSLALISLILGLGIFLLNSTVISSLESRNSFKRPADFSLYDDFDKVSKIKDDEDMREMIGEIYPVYGYEYQDIDNTLLINTIRYASTIDRASKSEFFFEPRFLLRESSFKDIFSLADDFDIKEGEAVALTKYETDKNILASYLKSNDLYIEVAGNFLGLKDRVYPARIFSNDVIGVGQMLAVDDRLYDKLIGAKPAFAYNVNLADDFINAYGFSRGSEILRNKFIRGGFKYESYIWQAKNAISSIAKSLYTRLYLGLIFLVSGLAIFAIRIFIIFEKNKDNFLILLLMGLEKDRLKKLILKSYRLLFLAVGLISFLISLYMDSFTYIKNKSLYMIIIGISLLTFILIMSVLYMLVGKISFERIISYEEDTDN